MTDSLRPIELHDIDGVLTFMHEYMGYLISKADLRVILLNSIHNDINASYLSKNTAKKINGIILTSMPGEWIEDLNITAKLSVNDWKISNLRIAYIHCLFGHSASDSSIAKELLIASMLASFKAGAMAVTLHANPEDSNIKLFEKQKFLKLYEYKDFWFFKDMNCPYCRKVRCSCKASEYIHYFPEFDDEDEEIIQGTR